MTQISFALAVQGAPCVLTSLLTLKAPITSSDRTARLLDKTREREDEGELMSMLNGQTVDWMRDQVQLA